MQTGRRRAQQTVTVEREKRYPLDEACSLLAPIGFARFDESVDIAVRLGVNPRHADQMEAAGADIVGADDLVLKVQGGFLEFDTVIATPDMMGQVGRLGRVLGPRGLMPNPKVGTVTADVKRAVQEAKAGKIEFRVEKAGIVHAPVGKKSFEANKLAANIRALLDALVKAKPSTAKGAYVRSITISTTMGPGIKVDPGSVVAAEA